MVFFLSTCVLIIIYLFIHQNINHNIFNFIYTISKIYLSKQLKYSAFTKIKYD